MLKIPLKIEEDQEGDLVFQSLILFPLSYLKTISSQIITSRYILVEKRKVIKSKIIIVNRLINQVYTQREQTKILEEGLK